MGNLIVLFISLNYLYCLNDLNLWFRKYKLLYVRDIWNKVRIVKYLNVKVIVVLR